MRKTALLALAASGCLAIPAIRAIADTAGTVPQFTKEIPKDQRIQQALSRLTFGARPGDVEAVNAMGLKKWIDQQLHPEQIPENPVLEAKLKYMDTLNMSASQMVRDYPSPQVVRQMLNGQMPYPTDPDRRMMIQKLAAREEQRLQGKNGQAPPGAPNPMGDPQKLRDLLTQDQIRALRAGTPGQRVAVLASFPPDKQADVIEALPGQLRQALFAAVRRNPMAQHGLLAIVMHE